MAIDGNSTRDFKFRLDDKEADVTLTVKDGIHLKLLERIAQAVQRIDRGV